MKVLRKEEENLLEVTLQIDIIIILRKERFSKKE